MHNHEERMERTALLDRHGSRGELHSAPASGGMVRNNSQPEQMDKEMAWLRRCLPIILQPKVDISNGYALLRVFFNFRRDIGNPMELICELELVYEGEGSYCKATPNEHNDMVSCMYRAKNLCQYGRTGDINHMQFRGVNFSSTGPPWRSVYTHDWCGNQTWAQGNGGDCFSWCSIMDHYMNETLYKDWQRQGDRPLLYVNTFNHMMGNQDSNPSMAKYSWDKYCVSRGTRADAEQYVKLNVSVKPNPAIICAFWIWCSALKMPFDKALKDPNDVTEFIYDSPRNR